MFYVVFIDLDCFISDQLTEFFSVGYNHMQSFFPLVNLALGRVISEILLEEISRGAVDFLHVFSVWCKHVSDCTSLGCDWRAGKRLT